MNAVWKKAAQDLFRLSRYAGAHPRFVQGGGGNCSVKFGGCMAVKASGFFLEEVTPRRGFVVMDLKTRRPLAPNGLRASMESGIHLLLGRHVIHTHPVAVAAFVCSRQGRRLFRKFFPGHTDRWVGYTAPGKRLARKIARLLGRGGKRGPCVLFLQNHGLFVSAENAAHCMALHEERIRRLEAFFGKPPAELPRISAGRYLSPDHAVYGALDGRLSARQRRSVAETRLFARQAVALMRRKGWQPAWLPAKEVRYVTGMEEEKYRQAGP